jgi:P27 family predicted phage terminase small subunit
MRGRKTIPTILKKLHGNPGKRQLPATEVKGQGLLWAPPAWFDDEQREQWSHALQFTPPGLLTATDREVLAVWCVAAVEHARAVIEVRKLGQVVKTKDGNAIQNPFLPIVNKQALIMLKAGSEMGFSPASRAALATRNSGPDCTWNGPTEPASRGGLAAFIAQNPDRLT